MATNNPSFQHGQPYQIDDTPIPKVTPSQPRQVLPTTREIRTKEAVMINRPTDAAQFLNNIRASLPRVLQ